MMGQDHQEPLSAEKDDWVFSSGTSLGALLKREREKKGLNHAQISDQTRLRPHFLEAIENEEWDLLPAPTLVKGFIRSYARFLGLDEERILDLYRDEAGVDDFSQKFTFPAVARKKKWPFMVVGLLILLAALWAFYMWFTIPTGSRKIFGTGTATVQSPSLNKAPVETEEQQRTEIETKEKRITEREPSVEEAPLPPDVAELPESPEIEAESEKPEPVVSKPAVIQGAAEESPQAETPSIPEEAETVMLRLKGHVTERTWVSISIDGLKAKEYTFGPSDTPEWEAEKGFELLIGNAGGIALEFNGKKLDNLGKQGQVVRIRLPENEERSPERN